MSFFSISAGCSIGESAKVSASVLGRGCIIEDGAVVEGCVLWSNVKVGAGEALQLRCGNMG